MYTPDNSRGELPWLLMMSGLTAGLDSATYISNSRCGADFEM